MRVARNFAAKPKQNQPLFEVTSTLTVPDELLAWGREPERALSWPRDWARDVTELARRSETEPLDEKLCETFLCRLEGLVDEAVRAGRSDLLVGLDVQTAEWLDLKFSLPVGDRQVSLGRTGDFSWSEVRRLAEARSTAVAAQEAGKPTPDPAAIGKVVLRAKDLLAEVFPTAQIGAIEPEPEEPDSCAACREPLGCVSLDADQETKYCLRCWLERTSLKPASPAKQKAASRRTRR